MTTEHPGTSRWLFQAGAVRFGGAASHTHAGQCHSRARRVEAVELTDLDTGGASSSATGGLHRGLILTTSLRYWPALSSTC
jgi:hypothetical protein